jgi:hypothetical protein
MIEKEKHKITPKTLEECDKLQCKDCSLCNEDEFRVEVNFIIIIQKHTSILYVLVR